MSEEEVETKQAPLVHPALRPKHAQRRLDSKVSKTTVRVAKLINPLNEEPILVQVPIEPSFNNRGSTADPTLPLRHYLDAGFVWPHEFSIFKYPHIYCAVMDCWEPATVNNDHEYGTERCPEHERDHLQRPLYATSSKVSE